LTKKCPLFHSLDWEVNFLALDEKLGNKIKTRGGLV